MRPDNRGLSRAALLFPALFLCACAAPEPAAQRRLEEPSGPGAAIVFEKRLFKLVRTPDPDLEAALEGFLSASYDTAVRNHAGDKPMDTGFTYSLAPKGAVYPFSEIEVSCIMQEKYARRSGPAICGDFFRDLEARLKRAVGGK
ncbi:MAG: hypothetical protein HY550_00355 [Elusimicrobia bacterium]|nr:hypothetical protein [Elusimicrobiota bacterium]